MSSRDGGRQVAAMVKLMTIVGTVVGLIINALEVGLTGSLVLVGMAAIRCVMASAVMCRWAYDAQTDPANQ